jgi:large subunit ribosomal protein L28
MAKSDITGKRKLKAQNVSHSNIKTKRWQNVTIQTRRLGVPELGKFVTRKLTARGIRTSDQSGLAADAKRQGGEGGGGA